MTGGLSPRLDCVARLIGRAGALADIGSDHALLPIALLRAERVGRAVAVEIAGGPWRAAKKSAAEAGFGERLDVRLGDGLLPLAAGEVDAVAIAGMGASAIWRMLVSPDARARLLPAGGTAGAPRLVLQPMGGAGILRYFAAEAGFAVEDDVRVREGEFIYECVSLRLADPDRLLFFAERPDVERRAAYEDAAPALRARWRCGERPLLAGCALLAEQMRECAACFRRSAGAAAAARGGRGRERAERLRADWRALAELYRDHFGDAWIGPEGSGPDGAAPAPASVCAPARGGLPPA